MSITQMKAWIDDSYWAWGNAFYFRFDSYEDNLDRCAFFEEINNGWYHMYIYPYDDMYIPVISAERRLRLSQQPLTFYVTEEDYDAMMDAMENPPEPSEALLKLFQRKIPWKDSND